MRKPEPRLERKDIPGPEPMVTRVGGGGTPQPEPKPEPKKEQEGE